MRKLWFTIVCAGALVCAGAGRALCYSLFYTDGSRAVSMNWRRQPVRLYLSTSIRTPPPNIEVGSDVEGAVRRALGRWERAAGVRFILRDFFQSPRTWGSSKNSRISFASFQSARTCGYATYALSVHSGLVISVLLGSIGLTAGCVGVAPPV